MLIKICLNLNKKEIVSKLNFILEILVSLPTITRDSTFNFKCNTINSFEFNGKKLNKNDLKPIRKFDLEKSKKDFFDHPKIVYSKKDTIEKLGTKTSMFAVNKVHSEKLQSPIKKVIENVS